MKGCIAGSQYIPSIEYFAHWLHHGVLMLEQCEHYQKRTWRNKTAIPGPDTAHLLTVPLKKGKHQQMNIDAVCIAYDTPWQRIHLNSLKSAYGKTAFFEELLPGLEVIFQTQYDTLWNLNSDLLTYILSLFKTQWSLSLTTDYISHYGPEMVDLRNGVPGGVSTLPDSLIPVYPQVHRLHKSHQPNLCILDPLCHLGPETGNYLTRYAEKLYTKP